MKRRYIKTRRIGRGEVEALADGPGWPEISGTPFQVWSGTVPTSDVSWVSGHWDQDCAEFRPSG